MIEGGADITAKTEYKGATLSEAIVNGLENTVKLLIEHDAKINDETWYPSLTFLELAVVKSNL